jgi:hypothetical protein
MSQIYTFCDIFTSMACLFDYLLWRGDLDFKVSPFNPVDNIILSQLSYLTLDGIVPGIKQRDVMSIALAVKVYNEKLQHPDFKMTSTFKQDPDLIRALGASKRFGNCQLFGYVNHVDAAREVQFSALCVYTNDDCCFVTYRGTDSSIVGWKEDFNMSFKEVIPSQLEAVKYLEKMAPTIQGPLRIGGHSKGGNLAIYAAAQCSRKVQKRITEIYSNDAPGFHENFISSSGFAAIRGRIQSYVPQSSIIGMFMENGSNYTVIKSNETGLMQHCLYSWEVTHNDLVRAKKSTLGSRFVNLTIREWINNHNKAQREKFIETLYHVLNSADIKSLVDIEKNWFTSIRRMFRSLKNVDEATRKFVRKTIVELFRAAKRNIETLFKP